MKIAFVYDAVYPYVKGGAEKRIYELSLSLVKRGHEVHIFGMKYWSGPDVIQKEGIIYHGVCRPKNLYVNGRRSVFQALYFSVFLFAPLLREKADVIDCQAFPYFSVIPSWTASKLTGAFFIVTWLEVWWNYWYEYLGFPGVFGKFMERVVSGTGDAVIAISGLTRKRLLNISGRKDIEVVSVSVDAEYISSVKPSPEVSDIIAVGRLIKEKNFGLLIKTIGIIKEKIPDIKVIIVGDGPCRASLLNLSKDCGTEENIKFYSFMDSYESLISLMKSSGIFASPSVREGFGISALEAVSCGLSVATVKGDMNAVSDLVFESGCGIVSENNSESFANALLSVYESLKIVNGKRIFLKDAPDMNGSGKLFNKSRNAGFLKDNNTDSLCGLYENILKKRIK